MNIEKLFKKAEKFFVLKKSDQEKKEGKREKLRASLIKKIATIKKKVKKTDSSDEKIVFKKHLDVLNAFLEKLNDKKDS